VGPGDGDEGRFNDVERELDELGVQKWAELVEMQQEQIRLLTKLLDEKH